MALNVVLCQRARERSREGEEQRERETVSRALAERGISSARQAGGISGRTSPMRVSSTSLCVWKRKHFSKKPRSSKP